MINAHRRKKDPEKVRMNLIESAKRLAQKNGFSAVRLDAVASDAGVTKGALFHHFRNKQALVTAVFEHLLQEFKHDLIIKMASDPDAYGRFTRAYVRLVFETSADSDYGPLWLTTLSEPDLRMTWGKWLNDLLLIYGELDLPLESARFAADGI